jgi:hypothetical protein
MQLATLHHDEMVRELAAFRVAVSSTVESVLGRSLKNIARVEIVGKMVAELHRVEGHLSKLERPTTKICDLLLEPPPSRAWLANHLEEAVGRLRVELDAQREAEAKLDALQSSTVQVRGLVLGDADGSSTQATSMSAVAELLKGQIYTTAANGVHWGFCSMLVAVVSHFLELDADLEVLGSGHSMGLTEDEVDILWSRVRTAAHSIASHVPSSVAYNPPDGVGE